MTTIFTFSHIRRLIFVCVCCCVSMPWNLAAADDQGHKLLLLFSGNVLGETGPCG